MKKMLVSIAAAVALSMTGPVAADVIVNNDGGVCIDAEGSLRPGARLIAFTCHGGGNQQAKFSRDRLIIGNQYCATARSRDKGAEIVLAQCDYSSNGNALQNFAKWSGGKIGHNSGYVLAAAGRYWGTNRPLCLWTDENRSDQKWRTGTVLQFRPDMTFNGSTKSVYVPGQQGSIAVRGGKMVAAGGGNMVAAGGGNMVAAGGGNIVAAGGLN